MHFAAIKVGLLNASRMHVAAAKPFKHDIPVAVAAQPLS